MNFVILTEALTVIFQPSQNSCLRVDWRLTRSIINLWCRSSNQDKIDNIKISGSDCIQEWGGDAMEPKIWAHEVCKYRSRCLYFLLMRFSRNHGSKLQNFKWTDGLQNYVVYTPDSQFSYLGNVKWHALNRSSLDLLFLLQISNSKYCIMASSLCVLAQPLLLACSLCSTSTLTMPDNSFGVFVWYGWTPRHRRWRHGARE
jgi:hypothetical protein